LEAHRFGAILIDYAKRMGSRGMDKPNSAGLWDDYKRDMIIEADNVDAWASFYRLVDEGIVVLSGTNRHHFF
jgi:hypothetical protein